MSTSWPGETGLPLRVNVPFVGRLVQNILSEVHVTVVPVVLGAGKPLPELLAIANAEVAATGPRKAIRGRASFLGDRSIGHIDPGARSSAVILEAVAGALQ